jgi:hypothetical protein
MAADDPYLYRKYGTFPPGPGPFKVTLHTGTPAGQPRIYGTAPALSGGPQMVQRWPDGTFTVGISVMTRAMLAKLAELCQTALDDQEPL